MLAPDWAAIEHCCAWPPRGGTTTSGSRAIVTPSKMANGNVVGKAEYCTSAPPTTSASAVPLAVAAVLTEVDSAAVRRGANSTSAALAALIAIPTPSP